MELTTYLEEQLDQQNADDRLLSIADIARLVEVGMALTRGEAESMAVDPDIINDVEFDEVNEDNPRVTITMQDLYPDDALLGKKVYFFRTIVFFNLTGRVIYVSDVDATADGTYEPLTAKMTFDVQRGEPAPVVKVSGFVVNWRRTWTKALGELEHKILSAPDIYGSRQSEWVKRIENYRLREWEGVMGNG